VPQKRLGGGQIDIDSGAALIDFGEVDARCEHTATAPHIEE
jgi:hypothetical protein